MIFQHTLEEYITIYIQCKCTLVGVVFVFVCFDIYIYSTVHKYLLVVYRLYRHLESGCILFQHTICIFWIGRTTHTGRSQSCLLCPRTVPDVRVPRCGRETSFCVVATLCDLHVSMDFAGSCKGW